MPPRTVIKNGLSGNNIFTQPQGFMTRFYVESQALASPDISWGCRAKKTTSESSPHFKDSTVAGLKPTL
jgi:alpha-N-acetylglucosamine transferase